VRPPVLARLTGQAQDQGKLRYDEKSLPGKGTAVSSDRAAAVRGRYRPPGGVTAHRPGALERVQLLDDFRDTWRRQSETEACMG
jgi:hypothetical protein